MNLQVFLESSVMVLVLLGAVLLWRRLGSNSLTVTVVGGQVSEPRFGTPPKGNRDEWVIARATDVRYQFKGRKGFGGARIAHFFRKKGIWCARMINNAGYPLSRPVAELQPPIA